MVTDIKGLEDLLVTDPNDIFQYCKPNERYDAIVFFDVETTGFNADKDDRIIELAAVRVDWQGNTEQEDFFIKLPEGRSIPDKITSLTGITNEMVAGGITEIEAMDRFYLLMNHGTHKYGAKDNVLLVAHNAQFDLNFVGHAIIRQWKELKKEKPSDDWLDAFMQADYLDTLTVYKDRRQYPHKLANAITAYHLEDKVQNTHRAIDDVLALLAVTRAMGMERSDLRDYINIFGYNAKYGVSGSHIKKVTYASQGFRDYMCAPEQTLPALLQKKQKIKEMEKMEEQA